LKNICLHVFTISLLVMISFSIKAQDSEDNWDNQLFIGNKANWGHNQWRFSGELQIRLKEDMKELDRWFLEGTTNFLINKNWEVVAPLRFSVTKNYVEWRPGLGGLYKMYPKENIQIVHQVQWQVDIDPNEAKHGVRYVAFINYVKSEKLIPNFAAGVFYRWQNDFTGIQFIRIGGGLAWIIDVKHALNFSYFVGMTNTGETWKFQGIPFLQLVININKDYKYLPAKYYNF
jgi:hypothetical protein